MRTSLATHIFKPSFVDEVEQTGKWSALVPYLRVGQAILCSLGSPEIVKGTACLKPLREAFKTIKNWNSMITNTIGGRIPTSFVTGLGQTLTALEWLIPKLVGLKISFSLRDISSDPVENWFSRLRAHQGLNNSFTVLDFFQMYVRMQLMTNGGEKLSKGSYEHSTFFHLDLKLAELFERKPPSQQQFEIMYRHYNIGPDIMPIIRPLRLNTLKLQGSSTTIKRLARIGGWLLNSALKSGLYLRI